MSHSQYMICQGKGFFPFCSMHLLLDRPRRGAFKKGKGKLHEHDPLLLSFVQMLRVIGT